ncbi:MAG TPA: FAD-binding protein [Myxococcota bacterium]|nr:FAD-binding protein [Myxococcota bacterium]HRY94595.1 FAD-binding protein [Myxococcota bacterium]HSA20323.1 FAD-binding protein [Myxococcota bacterium]
MHADALPAEGSWDVVVVGFGAAGASAALQAAEEGARVLVLERFDGGGSTRRCGGVIYAGGGTPAQRAAGFADRPEHMLAYLRRETRGEADPEALEAFCARSRVDLAWLAAHGLDFPTAFHPHKSVVPPEGTGLYYSGNEHGGPPPQAPRGHLPDGHGQRGKEIFAGLARAVRTAGIEVRTRHRVTRLLRDGAGRVTGVEALRLPGAGPAAAAHDALFGAALASRAAMGPLGAFERRLGRPTTFGARGGVVLAAGGFAFDVRMLAEYAPAFRGCMPLGTPGDDGAGIRLGAEAGGALDAMDRCAAWRFMYPPEAFLRGVLVNARGERFCDESQYGATVGRNISEQPGGHAWLVVDAAVVRAVRAEAAADERLRDRPLGELVRGQANDLVFRKLSTALNLAVNRRKARTAAGLERACGLPVGALERTLAEHNARAHAGGPDPFGKPAALLTPLEEPPFLAIVCDLDSKLFLGPCFTLGGLRTHALSGAVLDAQRAPIPGLYAAGRNAVGLCTGGYVSGLSIADCVFAGRNAGRSAARAVTAPT